MRVEDAAAKGRQPLVLVVEDEESFVDALVVGLSREGFTVEVARDGLGALTLFDAVGPDLVLLDLMLPNLSGVDVFREIRRRSRTPIIMVTAKGTEIDAVVGLEGLYASEWGVRVRIRGAHGRVGQVTPPAWRSTRSR